MEDQATTPIIHSYDLEGRRVLCGVTEQTHSTKHAAGVTCERCRQLILARAAAHELASAAHLG